MSASQKEHYYQRPGVVASYNAYRYGTPSGKLVFARETAAIRHVVGTSKHILDVPCGTGRLFSALRASSKVTGVDSSPAMLTQAKKYPYQKLIHAHAESLPLKKDSFDAVVSLRFFFHFQDVFPFLKEFKRVVKKDGVIIFETLNWSLRAGTWWIFNKLLGGRLYIHPKREVEALCRQLNLTIIECKDVFLLTPFMYKHLPTFATKFLFSLEKYFPSFLAVSLYKVKKSNQ